MVERNRPAKIRFRNERPHATQQLLFLGRARLLLIGLRLSSLWLSGRDLNLLALHQRVRRIDHHVLLPAESGNYFDFASEIAS
jgi:hypothetical protein